mmetsp:Transcript_19617/g.41115  ORF Transcript_19617/g.41115 Transcript_19617/m.41115 type:complete len:212 (-) Transcript_19617:2374-3009(-)
MDMPMCLIMVGLISEPLEIRGFIIRSAASFADCRAVTIVSHAVSDFKINSLADTDALVLPFRIWPRIPRHTSMSSFGNRVLSTLTFLFGLCFLFLDVPDFRVKLASSSSPSPAKYSVMDDARHVATSSAMPHAHNRATLGLRLTFMRLAAGMPLVSDSSSMMRKRRPSIFDSSTFPAQFRMATQAREQSSSLASSSSELSSWLLFSNLASK